MVYIYNMLDNINIMYMLYTLTTMTDLAGFVNMNIYENLFNIGRRTGCE